MSIWLIALIIGLAAGILSGILGIGGGVIMIPALIIFLKFDQHMAQGTTLAAMVPPIGLLAAYQYYKSGEINITLAIFIALGFILGGLVGAKIALNLPAHALKKIFAFFLIAISIKILMEK